MRPLRGHSARLRSAARRNRGTFGTLQGALCALALACVILPVSLEAAAPDTASSAAQRQSERDAALRNELDALFAARVREMHALDRLEAEHARAAGESFDGSAKFAAPDPCQPLQSQARGVQPGAVDSLRDDAGFARELAQSEAFAAFQLNELEREEATLREIAQRRTEERARLRASGLPWSGSAGAMAAGGGEACGAVHRCDGDPGARRETQLRLPLRADDAAILRCVERDANCVEQFYFSIRQGYAHGEEQSRAHSTIHSTDEGRGSKALTTRFRPGLFRETEETA